MRAATIEKYAQSGDIVARSIAGLSREQLLWTPSAEAGLGLWSIQQVVIHLMDSDLIWTARLKQMIAEDNPRIVGYDEVRFARELYCDKQSIEDVVTIFTLNRRNFANVLRCLPPTAWERRGDHSERGEIRLGLCLHMLLQHVPHHCDFIARKRQAMGAALA